MKCPKEYVGSVDMKKKCKMCNKFFEVHVMNYLRIYCKECKIEIETGGKIKWLDRLLNKDDY